ncbi:MAG TPA: hypothetical protein VEX41_01755 [Candidatus Eisenbacteria bacterium]|nr:hypothetical protein [Candidatus Eisenbacteria bacterium]
MRPSFEPHHLDSCFSGKTLLLSNQSRAFILALLVLTTVGCSLAGGTLGGREKCWPEQDRRAASIWRGILQIDGSGARLQTPEGEVITLLPGALTTQIGASGVGELVAGEQVVATAGEDVTLFGGAGSDGALVVCGVEEIHSAP